MHPARNRDSTAYDKDVLRLEEQQVQPVGGNTHNAASMQQHPGHSCHDVPVAEPYGWLLPPNYGNSSDRSSPALLCDDVLGASDGPELCPYQNLPYDDDLDLHSLDVCGDPERSMSCKISNMEPQQRQLSLLASTHTPSCHRSLSRSPTGGELGWLKQEPEMQQEPDAGTASGSFQDRYSAKLTTELPWVRLQRMHEPCQSCFEHVN